MLIAIYRTAITIHWRTPDGDFDERSPAYRYDFDPWPELEIVEPNYRVTHSGGTTPHRFVEVPDAEMVDAPGFPIGGLLRRLVKAPCLSKPLDAGQAWSMAWGRETHGWDGVIAFAEPGEVATPEPTPAPPPKRAPITVTFGPPPAVDREPALQLAFGWGD